MRFLVLIHAGTDPGEKPFGKFNDEAATAGAHLNSKGERSSTDYSEEAISERDPAYRTLDGTLYDTQTIDDMRSDERLALARCLEQLGMSAVRAALVANL
jgi:hypothetical protein